MSRHCHVVDGTFLLYTRIMPSTTATSVDSSAKLLLTADDVAKRLSLGRATVYLMMASGELPTLRKGRAIRVPARALETWIESRTNHAASRPAASI